MPGSLSGNKLSFIIPRKVIATEPMNITLYTSFPQLFRTSPLTASLEVEGPSVIVTGEIRNRTTMVLYFSPMELPRIQSKFVDLSLRVTVARNNFRCANIWLDVPLLFVIQGESRALDATSTNAASGAASAASIIGVNAAAASTQARTKMLSALVACSFDLVNDNSNSVTGLRFGAPRGQYLRGAIVGNWCLMIAFSLAVLLLAYTSARIIHRRHGVPMKAAWVSMTCILHLPSAYLVPLGLVLQPTVSATITLIMYPTGSSDAMLAAASLIGILALLGYILVICLSRFECELVEDDEVLPEDAGPWTRASFHLQRFFEGSQVWRTRRGCDPLWKMQFHLIFNDYVYKWFALVELAISITMGIVTGVKINSENACFVQLCIMLALYAFIMLLIVFLRPGISYFAQIFLLLSNVIGFVCCVLILIGILTSNNDTFMYSDYLIMMLFGMATIVSLKETVKMVLLIPYVIRYLVDLEKHPSFMTDTELEAHKKKLKLEQSKRLLVITELEEGNYNNHYDFKTLHPNSLRALSILADGEVMLPRQEEEEDDNDPFAFLDRPARHRRGLGGASPTTPAQHADEGTQWASPNSYYASSRRSRGLDGADLDVFSFATAKTTDMDIRSLPPMPKAYSSGASSSSASSTGGAASSWRSNNNPQSVVAVPSSRRQQQQQPSQHKQIIRAQAPGAPASPPAPNRGSQSLWQAMASGPVDGIDDDDNDPFLVDHAAASSSRPPSIWQQFRNPERDLDGDSGDEARRKRERRRRRKTMDIDDLL